MVFGSANNYRDLTSPVKDTRRCSVVRTISQMSL
ncbi:hypothetical protein [Caudoviricetes sp.]|nr:hypothetical protein [Caudoviricetes sp.]